MNRDAYRSPQLKTGYSGDLESGFADQKGPPVRTAGLSAAENRGKRAPREGSGTVIGSGAGAGGGGADEDYDSDPAGGGGSVRVAPEVKKPATGSDAPIGGSR